MFATTASSDPAYDGVALPPVALTNTDNEKAGFELNPPVGLASELGASATFGVALQAQPSGDVTLAMTSSDTTEGIIAPAQLAFTATNWSTPQTVTVTGQNDDLVDGNQVFRVDFAAATSTDTAFSGLKPASPWFTNLDDDTAALVVTLLSGVVSEAGTTATLTVHLTAAPTADVTLRMSVSDTTEATLGASALVFSRTDWVTPKTVTVTGLNDDVADGDQPFSVSFAPTESTDSTFAGLVTPQLFLFNLDNDTAGYRFTDTSGTLTEAGAEATATIALTSQPTADVNFSLSVDKPAEASVLSDPFTFTPTNWAISQLIRLKGLDEALDDGDQVVTVSFTRPVSVDDAYDSLTPHDLLFTNTDDDTAGVTTSPIDSTTAEDGSSASFTVVLNSEPVGDVVVSFDTSDPTEGTPSAIELLFNATSWSAPQTVIVAGVNDDVMDGDQIYVIDFTPTSSSDPNYDGLVPDPLSITNLDDDAAGISVSTTTGTTTEAGGSFSFTVRLTSEPTADVAIDVSSSDTTEGSVSSSQLVFTPLTWNQAATVKVTGVDDTTVDGGITYQITFPATMSTDLSYDGMLAMSIDATNLDNNISGLVIKVEGHADVVVQCVGGDYSCQAKSVCEQVTNTTCIWRQYECATGTQGSWSPNDGSSGGSSFNFAYTYDFAGSGNYSNICACTSSQMSRYGLAATHQYCGSGHWTRVP